MAKDKAGNLHLVYGIGDSIMYTYSSDKVQSFSSRLVIAVLPKLFSFATRRPQISATNKGVVVIACASTGNIYSHYKDNAGWKQGTRVNDVDTIVKEGLMALSADGEKCFCCMAGFKRKQEK